MSIDRIPINNPLTGRMEYADGTRHTQLPSLGTVENITCIETISNYDIFLLRNSSGSSLVSNSSSLIIHWPPWKQLKSPLTRISSPKRDPSVSFHYLDSVINICFSFICWLWLLQIWSGMLVINKFNSSTLVRWFDARRAETTERCGWESFSGRWTV